MKISLLPALVCRILEKTGRERIVSVDELQRLNKLISQSGYCSRREADVLIDKGQVYVNGERAEVGQKVRLRDSIKVKGKVIDPCLKRVYIVFNKPVGVTCTTDKKDKDNIIDFIDYNERIFHIGRLDKDSEGLIFLTNDGDIVNKILRVENGHEKEYIVSVNKKITDEFIKKMSRGVRILGTKTLPCRVSKVSSRTFRIILKQGLNRQIRRMCGVFDYDVVSLKRVRIMNIKLGNLQVGKWRYFTNKELSDIERLITR